MNRGILSGIGAYVLWGLLPVYWKQVDDIAAGQLIGHRIVWSFAMLVVIVSLSREWPVIRSAVSSRRIVRIYALAAVLITVNWSIYVWAVNHGFIVESSLGYFINPLVSVIFGVFVFGERLRPMQWAAVSLAGAGVAYLTFTYGALPWIALVLALSFGGYGAVKKKAPLASTHGLTIETGMLLLPAAAYLFFVDVTGRGVFLHSSLASAVLLIGTGAVTIVPLLLFASAVQRTPLSTMGVLQYIAPTLQLMLGVLVYSEPFTTHQLVGFAIVWTALALFGIDGLRTARRPPVGAVIDEGAG